MATAQFVCLHNAGQIPGKRYIEWDLPDPERRPVAEVRELRDEIARLVDRLVRELNAGP